jgi:hypothetical protein
MPVRDRSITLTALVEGAAVECVKHRQQFPGAGVVNGTYVCFLGKGEARIGWLGLT